MNSFFSDVHRFTCGVVVLCCRAGPLTGASTSTMFTFFLHSLKLSFTAGFPSQLLSDEMMTTMLMVISHQ